MLKEKIALVTGSSQGIGRAIALKFSSLGAKLALNDIEPQEGKLKNLKKEIEGEGGEAEYFLADVSDLEEVQKMMDSIKDKMKGLDILVNNAGICKDRTFAKMTPQEWQQVIDIDLTGVFNCTKAALPLIVQSKGKIVNLSSLVGRRGNFGQVNYAAAKAGIIGLTKALAKEVGRLGVNVNALAPGFIETSLTKNLPEEIKVQVKRLTALRRFGTPEEIADLAAFLASDQASFITGTVIDIDGGLSL
ncbi:MAG: SDR family oxidoreductase [Candidatus Nealsonbacteria bacterium]|nr:SDR family oxidoreductase [Candidatus Nealsonbacteria bacterium]